MPNKNAIYILRAFTVIAILVTIFVLYGNSATSQQFHSCFAITGNTNKTELLQYVNWTLKDSNNLLGNCSIAALDKFGQESSNRYNISINLTQLNVQYVKNKQIGAISSYVLLVSVLLLLVLILVLSYIIPSKSKGRSKKVT